MKKSDIKAMPEFFDRYINLADDVEIITALEKNGLNYFLEQRDRMRYLGDKVYAEGKWTVKDILQHIIDTERIFAYRALSFSRKDKTVLPGYDENLYAKNSNANKRHLNDILEEYDNVRRSSISLFKSFNNEQLMEEGVCWNKKISVLALGFTLVGHVIHHSNVLKERYYPMLNVAAQP